MERLPFSLWKLRLISDRLLKFKQKTKKKCCNSVNGALTVEVWGDGVPRQEAADCDLVDDVEQQEGHTGEAEGLQEAPCVACRSRRATVSSWWALRWDHTATGREGWEPPQLLHTWQFYSAPPGIWANFRSCYGDRSPQEDFFLMWKWKCSVSEKNKRPGFALGESAACGRKPWPKNSAPKGRGEPHHRWGAAACGRVRN